MSSILSPSVEEWCPAALHSLLLLIFQRPAGSASPLLLEHLIPFAQPDLEMSLKDSGGNISGHGAKVSPKAAVQIHPAGDPPLHLSPVPLQRGPSSPATKPWSHGGSRL